MELGKIYYVSTLLGKVYHISRSCFVISLCLILAIAFCGGEQIFTKEGSLTVLAVKIFKTLIVILVISALAFTVLPTQDEYIFIKVSESCKREKSHQMTNEELNAEIDRITQTVKQIGDK